MAVNARQESSSSILQNAWQSQNNLPHNLPQVYLNERVHDKLTTILSLACIAIILAVQCDGSFATSPLLGIKGR